MWQVRDIHYITALSCCLVPDEQMRNPISTPKVYAVFETAKTFHAGTDASEAFQAFKHPASARLEMLKYCVGFMETAREKPRTDAAQQLVQVRSKMEADGLFRVNYWNYFILAAGLAVAFLAVLLCVRERWVVPGALLLSLFWQQASRLRSTVVSLLYKTYSSANFSVLGVHPPHKMLKV
jgi:hypothetical protein